MEKEIREYLENVEYEDWNEALQLLIRRFCQLNPGESCLWLSYPKDDPGARRRILSRLLEDLEK